MINVNFYHFKKKKNSTAQPSGDPTVMPCAIKSDCSIVNPVLEIAPGQGTFVFNYAYIPDFGRYYFVNDWKYSVGTWTVYLSVDVLASYKTTIGNHSTYVLRSYSNFNRNIIDDACVTTADIYNYNETISKPFHIDRASLVIGITGPDGFRGGVNYYAMTEESSKKLFNWLLGVPTGSGTGNFMDWLHTTYNYVMDDALKVQYDPMQYIKSVLWYPFIVWDTGHPPAAVDSIKFGKYALPQIQGVSAWLVDKPVKKFDDIPVSLVSIGTTDTAFLNNSNFITRQLICAPFPAVTIPDSVNTYAIMNKLSITTLYDLNIKIAVDITSGEGSLSVFVHEKNEGRDVQFLTRVKCQIGISTAVSAATNNYVSGISEGAVNLIAGIVTGGVYGISAGIQKINNVIGAKAVSQGSNGSAASYYIDDWYNIASYLDIAERNLIDKGAPLCETVTLNTLSGYIQCADGDIEISGTEQEIDAVNSFLTGGFFYE